MWQLTREARRGEGLHAKSLLGELDDYLMEILGMQNHLSNMVFVVSLGDGGPWALNFKEEFSDLRREVRHQLNRHLQHSQKPDTRHGRDADEGRRVFRIGLGLLHDRQSCTYVTFRPFEMKRA